MPIIHSSVDYLVRYLYRTQPIYPEQIHFTRVDDNYISGEWNALTTRSHHKDKIAEHFIKRILSYDSANTLLYYLDNTTDPANWRYYRRKVEVVDGEPVFVYRREDTVIEASYSEIPGVTFQEIDLHDYHLHGRHNVYYDLEKNAMYLRTVKEAIVYDGMPYNSDHIDKLPNNHVYYMNFIDEEGWGGYGWDQFWKSIFNGIMNSLIDAQDRQFRLQYNIGTGKIPYYPELIIGSGSRLRPFKLIYEFLDGHQDPHGLQQRFLDNNYNHKKSLDPIQDHHAIHLEFPTVFGLLAFTNKLFFRNGMNSSIDLDRPPGRYLRFMEVYEEIITTAFQELNSSIDNSYLLKLLYFIPEGALKLIGKDALWGFLETVVEEYITNVRTDKEDIVMKVIQTLGEMYETSDEFLNELLARKVDKVPLLGHFTTRLDGYNFTEFVELIRSHWKQTNYASLSPEKNDLLVLDGSSQILLPYTSDKTLGFHHDNATIGWTDNYEGIFVAIDAAWLEIQEAQNQAEFEEAVDGLFSFVKNLVFYGYHPFSPIVIFSEQNPEFIFSDSDQAGSLFQKMPAFILFAREQRAWWANVATAAEYAGDILTSVSGVGNLFKAGRIFKIINAGKSALLKYPKLKAGAKQISGVIEITAGVGNGLLKLTGINDTEFGRALSNVLMCLEIAALTGEVSVGLASVMKKSSKKMIKHLDGSSNVGKGDTVIRSAEELQAIQFLKNLAEQTIAAFSGIVRQLIKAGAVIALTAKQLALFPIRMLEDLLDLGVEFFEITSRRLFRNMMDDLAPELALVNGGKIDNFATWKGNELFQGTKRQFDEFANELKKAWEKGGKKGLSERLRKIKNASLTQKGKKLLKEFVDKSLKKWGDITKRPGAVGLIEGKVNGKLIRIAKYSAKGIKKENLWKSLHPIITKWLDEIAPYQLRIRRTHGRCAEPALISEFLFESEKILGLSKGSITLSEAKKIFESTVITTTRIDNIGTPLLHGLNKKACASCNPMLEYLGIIEIN